MIVKCFGCMDTINVQYTSKVSFFAGVGFTPEMHAMATYHRNELKLALIQERKR